MGRDKVGFGQNSARLEMVKPGPPDFRWTVRMRGDFGRSERVHRFGSSDQDRTVLGERVGHVTKKTWTVGPAGQRE